MSRPLPTVSPDQRARAEEVRERLWTQYRISLDQLEGLMLCRTGVADPWAERVLRRAREVLDVAEDLGFEPMTGG